MNLIDLLKQFDVEAFYAYSELKGTPFPMTNTYGILRDELASVAMHKMRLGLIDSSPEEKQISRDWLSKRGCNPGIWGKKL